MASRPDLELQHQPTAALKRNRRALGQAKAKFDGVRENGVEPPLVRKERPQRERAEKPEKLAKGATGRETDFDLIMGKASKASNRKVQDRDGLARHRDTKAKGRSDSLPATLHVPIARPHRMATEDGRTSFHFSHDSVAKTRTAVVSETTGRVNRPGAAKAHNKYIERETAVAHALDGEIPAPANDVDAPGAEAGVEPAVNDNENQAAIAVNDQREYYLDRPVSRSFLRAYRAAMADGIADPDSDPPGGRPGAADGMRNVPGGRVVPDGRDAEMLLWADALPVVGRDGARGEGVRPQGDGDREGDGGRGGRGRLTWSPVRAWLSPHKDPANRVAAQPAEKPRADTGKAVAALAAMEPANDPKTPDGQGRYIERQEALAIQPDGTRVLFTNIDPDPEKRAEFWQLVEEHEYDASPDKISFVAARHPEFWQRVAAHADCPAKLREALAAADPAKDLSVESEDNVAMRKFLMSVEGWPDTGKRKDGEDPNVFAERLKAAPCRFHDGRGGRIQYRIIGELPHELDIAQRASILRTFSKEFEERKLPFVAVMHAPDHTNDDRNWHFHLVYYDRPCERMTAERLAQIPADPNPKNAVVDAPSEADLGKWDFTVVERYRTSSREVRERFPFAQQKVKEVAQTNRWIDTLRTRLADITNDHLQEAGVQRRVDPRRHSEMGIHADPQEHLGTKLAQLEAMGIATPTGVSNEERQWAAMQQRLDGDLERRKSLVDQQARKWARQAERATHLDEPQKLEVRGQIVRWHQHRIEAEEHLAIAENLDQHASRMTSRALKVQKTCQKHIDAIRAGTATKYQASRMEQLQAKVDDAVEWLGAATDFLKNETKLSADCRRTADLERLLADRFESGIERALEAPSLRDVAEERRRAEREQEQAQRRREAEERATQDRRALNRAEMDVWIAGIEGVRRLTQRGRRIEPLTVADEDRPILAAINYNAMQARLAGLKKAQDAVVADVVELVDRNPSDVLRRQDAEGRETFVLTARNRTLVRAFQAYQDDPEIRAATQRAMAANEERAALAAQRKAAETGRAAAPQPANDVAPRPADRTGAQAAETRPAAPADRTAERPRDATTGRPDEPAGDRSRTPAANAPDAGPERVARAAERKAFQDRIADAVANDARRVRVEDGVARLAERHLKALGVTQDDIGEPALQRRLAVIAGHQDREIRRLTGFARKNPHRLVESRGEVTVARDAPADVAQMARRWKGDEAVQATLAAIRDEALAKAKRPATPVVDITTVEPAPLAPREQAPAPVREPAPAEPRQPRITELTPDLDMRAEARAYAEAQERRRQAEEASRRETVTAPGEDPAQRIVRIASEKAATTGAHPLIDQWVEAVRDGRPVADRNEIALRIENDQAAREKLKSIDRKIARRIRDEAEIARAERQPGLGLEIDRGPAPRR